MTYENCFRVCGDRTKLVLKKIGFKYSNALLDQRAAVQNAVQMDVKFAFDLGRHAYGRSRFSDGTWPVMYTAKCVETSIHEVAYHARREWLAGMKTGSSAHSYKKAKKLMYSVLVSKRNRKRVDFSDPNMISNDYTDCHSVAYVARKAGSKAIEAPSARFKGGVCVPVFDKSAVKIDTGISDSFSIRWTISTNELTHFANAGRRSSPISFWNA